MCIFKKYRDLFGKPRTGVHKYRIFGFGLVDVLSTFLLAFIVWKVTNYPLLYVVIGVFIFGIIIHRLFCVNTTLNMLIFGEV